MNKKILCGVIIIANKKYEIPFWNKSNLTIEETAAYSGIGVNKIRDLTSGEDCPFVLWNGTKRLVKKRLFDEFIERQYSI